MAPPKTIPWESWSWIPCDASHPLLPVAQWLRDQLLRLVAHSHDQPVGCRRAHAHEWFERWPDLQCLGCMCSGASANHTDALSEVSSGSLCQKNCSTKEFGIVRRARSTTAWNRQRMLATSLVAIPCLVQPVPGRSLKQRPGYMFEKELCVLFLAGQGSSAASSSPVGDKTAAEAWLRNWTT